MPCSIPITIAIPGTTSALIVRYLPAQSECSPKRHNLPGTKRFKPIILRTQIVNCHYSKRSRVSLALSGYCANAGHGCYIYGWGVIISLSGLNLIFYNIMFDSTNLMILRDNSKKKTVRSRIRKAVSAPASYSPSQQLPPEVSPTLPSERSDRGSLRGTPLNRKNLIMPCWTTTRTARRMAGGHCVVVPAGHDPATP